MVRLRLCFRAALHNKKGAYPWLNPCLSRPGNALTPTWHAPSRPFFSFAALFYFINGACLSCLRELFDGLISPSIKLVNRGDQLCRTDFHALAPSASNSWSSLNSSTSPRSAPLAPLRSLRSLRSAPGRAQKPASPLKTLKKMIGRPREPSPILIIRILLKSTGGG